MQVTPFELADTILCRPRGTGRAAGNPPVPRARSGRRAPDGRATTAQHPSRQPEAPTRLHIRSAADVRTIGDNRRPRELREDGTVLEVDVQTGLR